LSLSQLISPFVNAVKELGMFWAVINEPPPAASKKVEMNFPLRVLHLKITPGTQNSSKPLSKRGIQSELTRVEREQDFLAALKRESLDLILADYTLPSFTDYPRLESAAALARSAIILFPERSAKTCPSSAQDRCHRLRLKTRLPSWDLRSLAH